MKSSDLTESEKRRHVFSDCLSDYAAALHATFSAPAPDDPADAIRCLQGRYSRALSETARFLNGLRLLHKTGDAEQHFEALAAYLNDLSVRGVRHPIFNPGVNLVGGRANDGVDVWGVRADAAIALEMMIATDVAEAEAAKLIAKKYPGLCKAERNRNVSRETVERGRTPTDLLAASLIRWRKSLKRKSLKGATDQGSVSSSAIDSFKDGQRISVMLADISKAALKRLAFAKAKGAERAASRLVSIPPS